MGQKQTKTPNQLLEELTTVLGFDPTKGPKPGKDDFALALEEIGKEQKEAAQKAAVELARKCITEAKTFAQIKKAFAAAEQKFVKEFTKSMQAIKAMSNGEEAVIEAEEEEKED